MIQNHVDHFKLSGRVHAVPTRATAVAADAATIIRNIIADMCLRSGAGFPDVLVVDHDAKFTSVVFHAFAKSMGSCLIVSLATRTPTPRWSGPIASSAIRYAPTPMGARTTATATSRSPSSPSTTRPRPLGDCSLTT